MKKDFDGRFIIRQALRVVLTVQIGAYGLMYELNDLPQNKAVNIMLSLTLWAIFLVALWFIYLVPEPPKEDADMEKVEKDRKNGFMMTIAATVAAVAIFIMQVITGRLIPFA